MNTPLMFDYTTEDRYWIDQGDQSLRKRKRDSQCLFSFLSKIDVPYKDLVRGSLGYSSCVQRYVELVCAQELSKETTGVQLNGCKNLRVCN
jgi:hypothetical protein